MLNRRQLFTTGAAALVTTLAAPSIAIAHDSRRHLNLINQRTGERFKEVYFEKGYYIQSALDEFDWFARDWRQGKAVKMSRSAMDIAADLQHRHGGREMLLISGYRTPKTNRSLNGAAKHSYHMDGKAMDLRMPGVSSSSLYRTAWGMKRGGVGKYSRSNFVHVDSGPVRTWGS